MIPLTPNASSCYGRALFVFLWPMCDEETFVMYMYSRKTEGMEEVDGERC
jgi:hypothetical protein